MSTSESGLLMESGFPGPAFDAGSGCFVGLRCANPTYGVLINSGALIPQALPPVPATFFQAAIALLFGTLAIAQGQPDGAFAMFGTEHTGCRINPVKADAFRRL